MKAGTKAVVVAVVAFFAVGSEALAASRKASKVQLTGVVNLNTATPKELDQLPGIGEAAVKRIVEHRSKTPFTRVEELVKVKGFGKKKLEKLKPYLTVSGPTTLKPLASTPQAAPRSVQARTPQHR